ncbi:hypothetical protein IMZ48_20770 [Candidatus Bathyarchaeota archaeon]|nr:hypothetical protein [Candidatus Bathyarchaeota archaeon]
MRVPSLALVVTALASAFATALAQHPAPGPRTYLICPTEQHPAPYCCQNLGSGVGLGCRPRKSTHVALPVFQSPVPTRDAVVVGAEEYTSLRLFQNECFQSYAGR